MFVKPVTFANGIKEEKIFPCDYPLTRHLSEDKIEIELCYHSPRKERHIITIPDDAEVVYFLNDRGDIMEAKRLNGSKKAQFRTGRN